MNVNESLGSKLEHSVNVRFRYCETRIDYMGTCILMGNVSAFRIAMSDDWKTNLTTCPSSGNKFEVYLAISHFRIDQRTGSSSLFWRDKNKQYAANIYSAHSF